MFEARDRDGRPAAVVLTTNGRQAALPLAAARLDVSLLGLLRSLLAGIEGLLVLLLIAGSRRENGGIRRNDRS